MFECFIVFVFGLIFGSFANVCIYRMPRNMSIVKPNSHCTNCNTFIKWYDNIPILSYILLKGKCRNCNSPISIKYPLVEFFCGILFLSMYYLYGFTFMLIPFCIFVFSLLVTTVIDFEFKIIPAEISFMLIIVGIATSFFNLSLGETIWQRVLGSFLGFFRPTPLGLNWRGLNIREVKIDSPCCSSSCSKRSRYFSFSFWIILLRKYFSMVIISCYFCLESIGTHYKT